MKILLLGTSRLHRAFAFNDFGVLETNFIDGFEVVYPRLGYFHSAEEMLQVLSWIVGEIEIPGELGPYVFRREPENTTPLNEFCPQLLKSLEAKSCPYRPRLDLNKIDGIVVEISTLLALSDSRTGVFLHSHPNIPQRMRNVKLKKWGDYAEHVDFEISRKTLSELDISRILGAIKNTLKDKRIMIMGHLHESESPNADRLVLNNRLRASCAVTGVEYFDPCPYVDQYGFRRLGETVDIHHLSHEGEFALGRGLQENFLKHVHNFE